MTIQSINSLSSDAASLNTQTVHSPDPSAAAGQSPQASASQTAQKSEPGIAEVRQAAKAVQEVVQTRADNLQFLVDHDKDTGQTIVKLTDRQSGDVILQIPSKQIVYIAQQIDKILGMFIQQKA